MDSKVRDAQILVLKYISQVNMGKLLDLRLCVPPCESRKIIVLRIKCCAQGLLGPRKCCASRSLCNESTNSLFQVHLWN